MAKVFDIPTRARVDAVVKEKLADLFEQMLSNPTPHIRRFLGVDEQGYDIYESDDDFRKRIQKTLHE